MLKRKLVVALVLASSPSAGGGYHQERTTISRILSQLEHRFEFRIFARTDYDLVPAPSDTMPVHTYRPGYLDKICRLIRRTRTGFRILDRLGLRYSRLEQALRRAGADIVYFLAPDQSAMDLIDLPYILTVWDLCHRDHP